MGEFNMVKNLVTNGAKINVYNSDGYTPLLLATRNGNTEVVKYLVDNGAFLNQKDKNLGYTELLIAASLGKKELVSYFIEKGADPSITTKDGKTAMDLAWYYGHKNIAYTLLADGTNDAKLKELVNQPQPLQETLADREATVWFLGTSGWAIKTKNHFLIFDYFFDSMKPAPADSSLASGYIAPLELKGQNITVFSSHRHLDHYSKNILKWKESLPDINYVLCFKTPDATSEEYTYIPIHEEKTVSGMKITTLKSTDMDGGYLVEVDGLTILHPGDLANGEDKLMKAYTDEIDRIAAKGLKIDLAFSPITGCSLGTPEQVKSGVLYMVDKLRPNLFIPMHANSPTDRFKKFADEMSTSNPNQKVQVVVQKGDRFTYKNGLTQK
jgi:ankyrin repeat protein